MADTDPVVQVLDRVVPPPDVDVALTRVRRTHRRRQRQRRAVGAGAVAVLALAVVAGALARRAGHEAGEPAVVDDPTPEATCPAPVGPGVPYARAAAALDTRGTAIEDRFGAITARVAPVDPVQDGPGPVVIEVTVPSVEDCPATPQVVRPDIPVRFVPYGDWLAEPLGPIEDVRVVNRGELPDGRAWRQVSFRAADGDRCVHLVTPRSGGGGCGDADPLNLGQSGMPALTFLDGFAQPVVATVRFSLSTGERVEVHPVDAGDEVNYVVFPVPGGVQVTDVDALDTDGQDLVLGAGADRFMTDEEDEAAVEDVFLQWLDAGTDVDSVVEVVEDGEALRPTIDAAIAGAPQPADRYRGEVDVVRLAVAEDRATVEFRIVTDDGSVVAERTGVARRIDGRWKVSRATYCTTVAIGPQRCPSG